MNLFLPGSKAFSERLPCEYTLQGPLWHSDMLSRQMLWNVKPHVLVHLCNHWQTAKKQPVHPQTPSHFGFSLPQRLHVSELVENSTMLKNLCS